MLEMRLAVFISTELYIVVLTCLVQKYYFLNYKGRKFTNEKLPEKTIPACISNAKRRQRKTLPVCPLSRGELFFFILFFQKILLVSSAWVFFLFSLKARLHVCTIITSLFGLWALVLFCRRQIDKMLRKQSSENNNSVILWHLSQTILSLATTKITHSINVMHQVIN